MLAKYIRNVSASILSVLAMVFFTSPAMAAPFTCSGEIYQVQSGQLRVFDPLLSAYVDVGSNQGSYNATGFNTADNFAYGMQGNDVIRIHSDGTVEDVYDIGESSFAGDVDDNNTLWLRGSSAKRLIAIDLANGNRQDFVISGAVNGAADLMFIRDGTVPYLLMVGNGRVGIVNLNTMTSTRQNVAGLPGGSFGAQWTDFNGRIFAFRNSDGTIHELFDVFTGSPTSSLAAQGQASGNNDGFSCPEASFPNLPPVAQDDDFTTPFETAISRNVLINNGNGIDFDPEAGPLTVSTTPVSGPSNGAVSIAANGDFTYTPAAGFYGTDSFTYQISDQTGLTATAVVTITVPAPPIDLVTVKFLASGNTNPEVGDIVTFEITVTNNGPADATGVSLTDQIPAGVSPTANNGNVTTGTYNPGSGLWNIGNLANGVSATLTIEGTVDPAAGGTMLENVTTKAVGDQDDPTDTGNDLMQGFVVFPLTLLAESDSSNDIVSSVGEPNALNVFDGDTLGGVDVVPGDMTLAVASGSSLPPELSFDTTSGVVGVAPGAAPGVYSFDYEICEIAIPSNCAIATATVTVVSNPIDAVNDFISGIVGSAGGTAVLNAYSDDTVAGVAASTTNGILTVAAGNTVPPELTFNTATGDVGVVAGTPAATYEFDYTLCEVGDPTNCDTATITVIVEAAEILAVNDPLSSVLGTAGSSNAGDAIANDTLNGSSVDIADLTVTILAPATPAVTGAPVPTLNTATGIVSVPVGTPASSYSIRYQICETINPMNCSDAFITITVTAPPIVAVNDTETGVNGITGAANVLNVLTDDTLDGAPATFSNVTLALASGETVPAELTFDATTGNVSVAANTAPGTYSFDYEICEILNPTNCSTATASVEVEALPQLEVTKVADDTELVTVGQVITYTYDVTNTGNVVIRDVVGTDVHNAAGSAPTIESETLLTDATPANDSTDATQNGSWDVLAPGDTIRFTGTYTVQQADIDNLQ